MRPNQQASLSFLCSGQQIEILDGYGIFTHIPSLVRFDSELKVQFNLSKISNIKVPSVNLPQPMGLTQ